MIVVYAAIVVLWSLSGVFAWGHYETLWRKSGYYPFLEQRPRMMRQILTHSPLFGPFNWLVMSYLTKALEEDHAQ